MQTTAASLRESMEEFLQERLQGKLDKLKEDDPKRETLKEQFRFENWVQDAARRVNQLQLVTHSLKAVHPDAKGTNLFAPPGQLHKNKLVGTHSLGDDYQGDVVGNAAALDVYKFLQLKLEGTSILERALQHDENLAAALSDDPVQSQEWIDAFASITRPKGNDSSHTKAKQIYFLIGADPREDEDFHLLAPLYATSLAHYVFRTINEDRFGDAAKAARQAKRNKQPFEHGYNDYPNLCVQKLGGTKPQNISQLNSERGGQNYLLASLPPIWHSASVKPPLNTDSAFNRFAARSDVRYLLDRLSHFLSSDPPSNKETRDHRDSLVEAITAELLNFAAELRNLPAGWSLQPECQINEAEALWLDPGRAEMDEPFRQQWQNTDWPRTVCNRFANWLNAYLSKGLSVGDAEQKQWSADASRSAHWLRQIDDDGRWINAIEELEEELAE